MKGKHLAKACECLKNAMTISNDFEESILDDLQLKIKGLVQKYLIDKIEDSELLCTIFEMIFQNLHAKMKRLVDFVGSELY